MAEHTPTVSQALDDTQAPTNDRRREHLPPRPTVSHIYQNHHIDSTLWQHYRPRADDIVVATSYKSGTTWTQAILAHLILGTHAIPDLGGVSPWFDMRRAAASDVMQRYEAQSHRRFIKSHVPLDGLPFYPQVKYIVVGRDARDVGMSMWNHYAHYTAAFFAQVNDAPGRLGPPLPPAPKDIHAFWRNWITTGWFAWEREGYPYWGNLQHTATWWAYRDLENILFVHFNDLLADLRGEIRRIVQFLEMACSEEQVAAVAHAVTFATMQQNAAQLLPRAANNWEGGAQTFMFKGTNGRWKEVLTAEELTLYTEKVAEIVTPECAAWLEHGRVALT